MLRRIAGTPFVRQAPIPVLLLFGLVIGAFAHEHPLTAALRGESWVEDDLRRFQAHGYYEDLIGASEGANAGADATVAGTASPAANPSSLIIPFRAAGIVEEVQTYVRWRMRPNLDIRWNGTTFRTNSLGFRTPEVSRPKPPGTYRIAIFGSSNTMGHGVNDEDTYPRRLERWLQDEVGPARQVEVMNLAVSGDSPTRRLERLREEGGRYQADCLLCEACVHDFILEEAHLQAVVRRKIPVPFEFVRESFQRAAITAADSPVSFHRKLRGQSEALLAGAYRGWKAESERRGIPLMLVILPRSDHKQESPRAFRQIRSLANLHGLESFDLTPAYSDLDEKAMQVSELDNHPSALAHRKLFETLRDALQQRGGLPGLPVSPRSTPSSASSSHREVTSR